MRISGSTIFVAGGTSGIGLGLALRLRQAGNQVIVGGRRTDLLDRIAAEHPDVATVVIDTSDAASVTAAAREVIERFPDVNVVVAMAGIMLAEDVHSADFLPVAEATVATNLLGPLRLVAAFVGTLRAQPEAAILTVSSGLAFVPLPITPTYNATKAAIHSLSESMRVQLADTAVQVIELVPPAVRTALMGQQDAENAMPLDEFLDETMMLLESQPDATEILVERVKPLRHAEVDGTYDKILATLGGH